MTAERIREIIHPATLAQVGHYHELGLRERTLTLPIMVALALSLVWRQFASVSEALRVMKTEGLLWSAPLQVSQQALSERLRMFPAELFEGILRDSLVRLGQEQLPMRLVEAHYQGVWYRYLTSELDPQRLPPLYIVALYWQRWRIEDALQLWATWLMYAVLVDLADDVADTLSVPFNSISLEMVYRSLYFCTTAFRRGEADDLVAYLVANAKLFGLIKRKPDSLHLLNLTVLEQP